MRAKRQRKRVLVIFQESPRDRHTEATEILRKIEMESEAAIALIDPGKRDIESKEKRHDPAENDRDPLIQIQIASDLGKITTLSSQ